MMKMKLNLSKSDGVKDKFNGFKLDNLKKTFFLRVFLTFPQGDYVPWQAF